MPPGLRIRKLADTTAGERVTRWNPDTGEKYLMNPATGEPEPWPLAGVQVEGDPPDACRVSTGFVDAAVADGWMERVGERVVHRPGGPRAKPWQETHTFVHCDELVMHLVDGDLRYRVTGQPDKYHGGPEGSDAVEDPDAEVRHFYTLELSREG